MFQPWIAGRSSSSRRVKVGGLFKSGSMACRKRSEEGLLRESTYSPSTARPWTHPYTSQIEGKLREVRLRFGKTRYRVLYFFDEARVGVLLHGFTKDTAAVEEVDKKIGRSRMAQHAAKRKRDQEKGKDEKGRPS